MKIKTKKMDFEKAFSLPRAKKMRPLKPSIIFRALIRILAIPDMWQLALHTPKLTWIR